MYCHDNCFILAPHLVFLGEPVFRDTPKTGHFLGCAYQQNISGFRKEAKETRAPTCLSSRVTHKWPPAWVFRTRRRPHVDNPREGDVYYRLSGKIGSNKSLYVYKCHFVISIAKGNG